MLRSIVAVAVVSCACGRVWAEIPDPQQVSRDIKSLDLRSDAAVQVTPVDLRLGPATIRLLEGTVFPASPVAGRTMEIVVVGKGRFRIEPPDRIEEAQLELFTGHKALDEEFTAAVLVGLSQAATQQLLAGPPARPVPDSREHAEKLFAEWLSGPERRRVGLDEAEFREALGDESLAGFCAAAVRGAAVGDFLFQVDPEERDSIIVGRYTPAAFTDAEKFRFYRDRYRDIRAGRLSWFDFDLAGVWDVWMAFPAPDPGALGIAGTASVAARNVRIEVTVAPGGENVSARAKLGLRVVADQCRVVPAAIHPDLHVREVLDEQGAPLVFRQDASSWSSCPAPLQRVASWSWSSNTPARCFRSWAGRCSRTGPRWRGSPAVEVGSPLTTSRSGGQRTST
ncbi:MAG: hypothetical protein KBD01_18815 [Acidobacteria bacterium]|nr:hypothetical protein [Acidobacteriota bacterium]